LDVLEVVDAAPIGGHSRWRGSQPKRLFAV
jgi:hypothetical protein